MGMTVNEVDEILKSGQTRAALPIRSPINGLIVRFGKVLGEGVAPNDAIFEVHDLSQSWAKAFVSEGDAPKVRIGTPVRVRLLSDPTFVAEGKVVRSARTVGSESRTLAVWIEFTRSTPQPLQRNLLGQVSATISAPDATLAVPLTAIVREQTRNYVFIQKERGLLERRGVVLGRADDRFVGIRQGLSIGEPVAVQGTAELQTTYASVR
jgi:cobalt-zinc-cadmium efflux system membrane fusion protein